MNRVIVILLRRSIIWALISIPAWPQHNFVYTNDDVNGGNTVSAFSVSVNGTLSVLPGSPFATGGLGFGGGFFSADRITSIKKFLYVSNGNSANVSVFRIDPESGTLVPIAGSPFAVGGFGSFGMSLAATPDGKFLFVGEPFASRMWTFSVASTGGLTALGPPLSLGYIQDGISHLKVTPDGKFLAVVIPIAHSIAMLSIAGDGTLTQVPGSPFPAEGEGVPTGLEISCASDLLFAGESFGNATVFVYEIANDGVLTPVPGSPFTAPEGAGSIGLLLSEDEKHLFVSNTFSDSMGVFALADDGSLASGAIVPLASGGLPSGTAMNKASTLLYTANFSEVSPSVGVFRVTAGGVLTPVAGSPFKTGQPEGLLSLTAFPARTCAVRVAIDIKPGSSMNPINIHSQGKIPVAVLSTMSFDAHRDIIVHSVTFGETGNERSLAFCDSAELDVNGDGLPDLLCHFNSQISRFRRGDIEGVLKAKTVDGRSIEGADTIRIVGH